jgi:hypothetical protein
MARCAFSETQFAFQYVFEHYNKFPFSPFPFFPDTVAEGRYYGFDVCLGSLFYQFKISNLFESRDVKGPATRDIWSAFSSPCYTKPLNLSGRQFQMLKRIASLHRYNNSVFYVMPRFHTRSDIKDYYISKDIINASAHFNVNDFPNALTGTHTLVYTENSTYGVLFSEPSKIQISINPQNIELFLNNKPRSLFDTAKELVSLIDDDVEFPMQLDKPSREASFVKTLQAILLNEYDTYWFPIIDPRL